MENASENLPLYPILFIVGKHPVFGSKTILFHVPEGFVKAGIGYDFVYESFDADSLRLDVYSRIECNGNNSIRIKTWDLLTLCRNRDSKKKQRY